MRVTALGSGDAFHGGGRGHAALLVEDSRGPLLLDCGTTAVQALARLGADPSAVGLVVLTHLHGDHFGGLPFLYLDGLYNHPRRGRLVVAGPPGTAGRVEAAFRALYGELAERPRPWVTDYREVAPGGVLELEGRRLQAFAVQHVSPPGVALAWRLESDGRAVGCSGDTLPCEGVAQAAAHTDLFACECTLAGEDDPAPEGAAHLSVGWVRRARPAWTAQRVVLMHLSAEARARAASVPGVEVADDGWSVELPVAAAVAGSGAAG